MVRQGTAFLFRMLLSLALVVAALPLRASAPTCAPKPVPAPCAMACCAKRAMVACMEAPAKAHRLARRADPCGCAVDRLPAVPPTAAQAVVPAFELELVVTLGLALVVPTRTLLPVEPGLFGLDSGPPPDPTYRSDASRAPPVVRA